MAKLTDSEWKVLNALWAGGPQTLGQVLERLEGDTGWSRTTVHTYLTRMMGKGLVSADEHSPRRYSAAVMVRKAVWLGVTVSCPAAGASRPAGRPTWAWTRLLSPSRAERTA